MKKIKSSACEKNRKTNYNLLQRIEGFHLYRALIGKLAVDITMALCWALVTAILAAPICVILTIWIVPRIMGSQMDKIDSTTLAVIVLIIVIWEIVSSAIKAVWKFGSRERAQQSRVEEGGSRPLRI